MIERLRGEKLADKAETKICCVGGLETARALLSVEKMHLPRLELVTSKNASESEKKFLCSSHLAAFIPFTQLRSLIHKHG